MINVQTFRILGSVLAIGAVFPGGCRVAEHFRAYELIWLVPFPPAFIVTFFWIVVVMVGHFIKADSYKDPRAINQAKRFLVFFDWLFLAVIVFFVIAGVFLFRLFPGQ